VLQNFFSFPFKFFEGYRIYGIVGYSCLILLWLLIGTPANELINTIAKQIIEVVI
jgi:hypothetical protein